MVHDVSKIECPCFIYHGPKEEVPLSTKAKLINASELIIMEGHGHCSIIMEFEKIAAGLVEGRCAKQLSLNPTQN